MKSQLTVEPEIGAVANWYGTNRTNAEEPGKLLEGCNHVTVPFAGSMCEIPYMPPKAQLLVCDAHKHVINLAKKIRDNREQLAKILATRVFHPVEFAEAQARLRELSVLSIGSAADYFMVSWMSRSGSSGTDAEFTAGMSIRFDGYWE